MNRQIIKYGAALAAAMFALSSCHWHSYDNHVRYVEQPARPVVVHRVDPKPKLHKPKRHHKAPKHVKRQAPAPKHVRAPQPAPPAGPHRR